MSDILPDPSTDFGERVARRLRDEVVIWMTVIDTNGTPQPTPVWFLWDDDSFLIYSRGDARRLAHIQRNPHISLNFNGNSQGVTSSSLPARQDSTPMSLPAIRYPPMSPSTATA